MIYELTLWLCMAQGCRPGPPQHFRSLEACEAQVERDAMLPPPQGSTAYVTCAAEKEGGA